MGVAWKEGGGEGRGSSVGEGGGGVRIEGSNFASSVSLIESNQSQPVTCNTIIIYIQK